MIKRALTVVLTGLILVQVVAYMSNTPVFFSFTLSNSMHPTIGVGDFYVIVPRLLSPHVDVDDIIVFRSPNFDHPICHRVIGLVEDGYVTRGDNSPFSDQQAGMSPVYSEDIIGKVLIFQSKPVIIPKIGLFVVMLQSIIQKNTVPFALVVAVFGVALLVTGKGREFKRVKRRRFRLRVKHVFLACLSLLVASSTLIMISKSGALEIKYLATESMYAEGRDIIRIGETSERYLSVNNTSLVPFYVYAKAVTGGLTLLSDDFALLMPGDNVELKLQVKASEEKGWHTELAEVYLYIAVLPSIFIKELGNVNPYIPILLSTFVISAPFIGTYLIIHEGKHVIRFRAKTVFRRLREVLEI